MQVSGGSQNSFNAVNTLRLLGRCVRMITIPPRRSSKACRSSNRQKHDPSRLGETGVDFMKFDSSEPKWRTRQDSNL
jgi:hypothetical protein